MIACDADRLEALAYGELPPPAAEGVARHARACAECARELAALRAERSAFARRASPPVPSGTRRAVERRLDEAQPRRWLAPAAWATALAVALLLAVAPGRGATPASCPDPRSQQIAMLEAGYGACLLATPVGCDQTPVCWSGGN